MITSSKNVAVAAVRIKLVPVWLLKLSTVDFHSYLPLPLALLEQFISRHDNNKPFSEPTTSFCDLNV